jgi:hypothetical protein
METLVAMVRSLSEKLAELETSARCAGDWTRLEAAVTRVAIAARLHITEMCPTDVDCDELSELFEELRYIKLCAEMHLFDPESLAAQ